MTIESGHAAGSAPLVSVLIATYNQSGFLDDSLRSVLTQDIDAIEVIVADDGSTDGTPSLVGRWADAYPQKLVPLVGLGHVGLPRNCNRGLQRCRGKYIAFQAGDDLFLPGKLRRQVEWLEADSRRTLCSHDIEVFDSDSGRTLKVLTASPHVTSDAGLRRALGGEMFGQTVMVRATALPATGYDERLPYLCDSKLWVDCLSAGGAYGHLPGVYARYRRHAGNLSNMSDAARADAMFDDTSKFYDLVAADHPELADLCQRYRTRLHWLRSEHHLHRGERVLATRHLEAALTAALHGRRGLAAGIARVLPSAVVTHALETRRTAQQAARWVRRALARSER